MEKNTKFFVKKRRSSGSSWAKLEKENRKGRGEAKLRRGSTVDLRKKKGRDDV